MQCCAKPFWRHSDLIEIYNESNLDTMARMPDNCIDLTVTSPPYDNLRDYKGYSFEFEEVAKELCRITKPGGVVVWVVGDATKDGSESGTSFRQALYFMQLEFNLHDTMIYAKNNYVPLTHNRYEQQFEYMFVFSKGKPKVFNPLKERSTYAGTKNKPKYQHGTDGVRRDANTPKPISDFKIKPNIWFYDTGNYKGTLDEIAFDHPATFPEDLSRDHIMTWSNEGDLVYEPFGGSGTTAKMAYLLNRRCIMSEISKEYCELSVKRLTPYVQQQRLFA